MIEREADARLIAAAPEMLEACKAAIKYDEAIRARTRNGQFERASNGAITTGADLDALYEDWMLKSRAVLKKVEVRPTN